MIEELKIPDNESTDLTDDKIQNLEVLLQSAQVLVTDKILQPKPAWVQTNSSDESILGTLGNFSLVIGKAKSKKSFFINIAISAVTGKDLLLGQFRGCLAHDKRTVLYFDTEQGKYHVQLALKRICAQINLIEPENLKVYGLRPYEPLERLKMIEYAITHTENLGFVVIDGIKDLVTSINDEEQATMIASKLLKWTDEREIHILTVLHQNKSDNNARGHIGTELINKAETVLSVTKNENDNAISVVEPQQCRNKEPEPFAFEINNEGIPILVKDFHWKKEGRTSKTNILEIEKDDKIKVLLSVFEKEKEIKYSDLYKECKVALYNVLQINVGDNKAKDFITSCKKDNLISQSANYSSYRLAFSV